MVARMKPFLIRFLIMSELSKPTPTTLPPDSATAFPIPTVEPSFAPKMPTQPCVIKFAAASFERAASPSQYCVTKTVYALPAKAERNPSSRATVEAVAAFTEITPIEPDVIPLALSALIIVSPAVFPALRLSVESVCTAG